MPDTAQLTLLVLLALETTTHIDFTTLSTTFSPIKEFNQLYSSTLIDLIFYFYNKIIHLYGYSFTEASFMTLMNFKTFSFSFTGHILFENI